jgi:hypothetical protein
MIADRLEDVAVREGDAMAPYVATRSADVGVAAFISSRRLFYLKGEAATFSNKDISATVRADVMGFGLVILSSWYTQLGARERATH